MDTHAAMGKMLGWAVFVIAFAVASPARADGPAMSGADWFDGGRLLGTAGVSQVDGAAGGGLVPWAVIAGYGTRDSVGATVHGTAVLLPAYTLVSGGAAIGLFNRVEFSFAHTSFDTGAYGAALGLGRGYTFDLDTMGAKVRLFGDVVYDQDTWMPQVAAGVLYAANDRGAVLRAVGARRSTDAAFYLAATKLLLAESVLLDATVRLTRANQFGILGFGGDRDDSYHPTFEGSAAYLVSRHLAVGAEIRTKPNNLSFAREGAAYDAFAAVFVTKATAITIAYANLGDIAGKRGQDGLYLSLQLGF